MSDRRVNLVKNTALFAIGNLGSKLLQIILVPYYTRVMTSAQFGVTDVLQAIVALLTPIFALSMYEGVFRFAMNKEYDKTSVFSAGTVVVGVGAAVLCGVGGILSLFVTPLFVWLVVGNTITVMFRSLLSQYARAINRIGLFTLDNVLITFFVLLFNVFFITEMKWGVEGYLLGYVCANFLSCIILACCLGKSCRVKLKSLDGFLMQGMLLYAAPLIPNAICWWGSNFIDRMVIAAYIGSAATGLYAAAHKIPSLLTVVVTIFFQAWQISANEEFKKKDISAFYSEIHDQIFASICLLCSVLILLCRPITDVFLGASYESSWLYMPVLLLAMTFFSFGQFLGSIYSANMRTGMAFVTNLIALLINVILNLVLVNKIGVLGAGVASACSYLALWLIRAKNTAAIVRIRYHVPSMVAAVGILIAQTVLVSLNLDVVRTYCICAVGTVALLVIFRKTFASLIRFIAQCVKKVGGL